MSKSEFDAELKKAFMAQHQKLFETTQKLKLADLQIEALQKQTKSHIITQGQLAHLPDDTKTYQSTGRMFVLRTIPEVKKSLDTSVADCKAKIGRLEHNKAYLKRNLMESENNLREMVQHRKDMSQAVD